MCSQRVSFIPQVGVVFADNFGRLLVTPPRYKEQFITTRGKRVKGGSGVGRERVRDGEKEGEKERCKRISVK